MFEEPELYLIEFNRTNDAREESNRQRQESRRRYADQLSVTLENLGLPAEDAPLWAESIFDSLFVVRRREDGEAQSEACLCSCHPQVPATDFHDYGFGCSCRHSPEERHRWWDDWKADMDAYWESPEGREVRAERQAEEDELAAWLVGHPDVDVRSYGGMAPEQWWGSVEGHSFYFRERHGDWRVEVDLRPSGHFFRALGGGSVDGESSYHMRESEVGDVIARGTVDDESYGRRPVERIEFLVRIIRDHLQREACDLHTMRRADLESRIGWSISWCPSCGTRL